MQACVRTWQMASAADLSSLAAAPGTSAAAASCVAFETAGAMTHSRCEALLFRCHTPLCSISEATETCERSKSILSNSIWGTWTVCLGSYPAWGPMNLSQLLRKGGSSRLHCSSLSARQASLTYSPSSSLKHHGQQLKGRQQSEFYFIWACTLAGPSCLIERKART
jgi:hypothetical protein